MTDHGFMASDTHDAILEGIYALYPTSRRYPLKETHTQITHVAHGWYMRVKRSCRSVMVLREAGYAAEAWPVRRAVIEHMLALRWLAEKGNEAKDVVVRTHGETARRRQRAAADAEWSSAGWPIWGEVREDASAAASNIAEDNMLTNVYERCARYGVPGDYASWLIETNHSHPGWETASPYLERSPTKLLTQPKFDQDLGDAEFCARRLLRSLVALSDMTLESPWDSDITDLMVRLTTLTDA